VISEVNGKKIRDMRDLVDAFENNKGKYHVIVNERGYRIVLDREKAKESTQRILKKYNISSGEFLGEP